MKPFVKVTFDFGEEVKEVKFTNKENLEELIDTLTAAYAELEHRIEMKRIKNRNKRLAKRLLKNGIGITLQEPKGSDFEGFKEPPTEDNKNKSMSQTKEDLIKEYKCVETLYNNLPDCKFKSDLKPYLNLAKVLLECVKK